MTTLPTCPRCSTNDRVETLPAPEQVPGTPLMEAAADHPFFCARCVLPFTGTDEEFVRMTWVRDSYRKRNRPPTRETER